MYTRVDTSSYDVYCGGVASLEHTHKNYFNKTQEKEQRGIKYYTKSS